MIWIAPSEYQCARQVVAEKRARPRQASTRAISYVLMIALSWTVVAQETSSHDLRPGRTNAATSTPASEAKKDEPKRDEAKGTLAAIPDASRKPVLMTNSVTLGGKPYRYISETGMLPLLKPDGTAKASVFYVAYTLEGETNAPARPVTFSFNGGPGSSSVWLHLGALGPRRVKLNDDGTLPRPPFGLVDNDYSALPFTDLVFIDPVATGYSRPAKDEKSDQFFGQSPDVESVGEFIRLWTTRHQRWLSPKFLCGESYGVFRSAGLAEHLHSRYGMYLNGLILVSGLLDFATLREGPGNDLPSLAYLPAYTAIAHYHKKLPPDLQADRAKALAEVREFVRSEYASALWQGAALPENRRKQIVTKLARLTGLPERVIADHDLQVDATTFRKELLRDQGLILGRYDARITGRDADAAGRVPRFDPSFAATLGPFSAAMNSYVRAELNFEDDLPYEILAGVQPWNYDARTSYPSVADRLASVMSQNPHLRILVLGGLCDLACPMDGIRYSFDHLQLDEAYRKNIRYAQYESGHMMYVNLPDLKKMQQDLADFIEK